jgi:beta-N-acetylhexosaminidase
MVVLRGWQNPGVDVARIRRLVATATGLAVLAACASSPAAPEPNPSGSANLRATASQEPSEPPSTGPALDCVARLPQDVRIGQTMLVTTTDLPRVQGWLDDGLIAGILANGTLTPASAAALDEATTSNAYGALLAADEEGGGVQRYREVVGPLPSAQRQAATMTPDEVRTMWTDHAQGLSDWGVDLVLAPVVDVGHGPGIGSRAYSDDPGVVAEYGRAAAEGIAQAGLLPVLKHFPGHGSSSGDSHYAQVEGPGIEQLRSTDLVPYESIVGEVPVGVLVGHTTVPGFSELPSSQSEQVIDGLLVDELGFDGLIVSDALGMAASGRPTQGEALVGFVAAGGDLGIVGPGGSVEGRRALRAALRDGVVGEDRLNEAAAAVLAAKGIDPCALDVPEDVPLDAPDPTGVASDEPVRNPTEAP